MKQRSLGADAPDTQHAVHEQNRLSFALVKVDGAALDAVQRPAGTLQCRRFDASDRFETAGVKPS